MPLMSPSRFAALLVLCGGLSAAAAAQPAHAQQGLAGAYLAGRVAAANNDIRAADQWFRRAEGIVQFQPEILRGQMLSALSLGDLPRASALADTLSDVAAPEPNAILAQMAARALAKDYTAILQAMQQGASLGLMMDDLVAGWAHIGLGQMNDGIARFDALAQQPGLAGFGLYHKAIALALAGNLDGAATTLAAPQVEGLRTSRRGVIFHAQILSQLGQTDQALAVLTGRFNPAFDAQIQALTNRLLEGEALPLLGFEDAASGMAEAFFSLAVALGEETDPAFTLLYARIAATLRPSDTEAILLTASLLEQVNQFDLAAETYGQIPKDHPDFPSAEVGRADAIYAAGRTEESLDILRQLAADFPKAIDVQVALGNGLRRAELFADAIAAYDLAIAMLPAPAPQNWPLFYSRAIALDQMGDFTRAEADFRKALELSPDQPNVLNYLGYSLVDRGQKLEEALGMIQRAVAEQPNSGYIVDSLAWALFRLGRYAEALEPMERAALLEPVDPIVTDHLGDVYWANGRKREAQFQWHRALSFNPTEKDAARIRLKLDLGLDEVRRREGSPPFPETGKGGL